jgi:hypothetical protein
MTNLGTKVTRLLAVGPLSMGFASVAKIYQKSANVQASVYWQSIHGSDAQQPHKLASATSQFAPIASQ